ncbi:hypothetical protein ACRAWF_27730 [Streptomyces sp. L7]
MFDSAGVHVVATAVRSSPRRGPGAPRPARRRLPVVVRRAAQHGLVLAAVAVTVLLCATALATLASLAGSSVQAGAVRRLTADLDAQVNVNASFRAGEWPLPTAMCGPPPTGCSPGCRSEPMWDCRAPRRSR